MKRPAFQFYPGDWQRDAALRACSVGARGLWIEMICIMHQAEPYGHLVVNGLPIAPETLARMVGCSRAESARWLAELEAAGVYNRDGDAIVSRRMVRDERLRKVRAEGGKLGGNPALMDKAKVTSKVNHNPNLQPTPSSSSSTSSSTTSKPSRASRSVSRPEDVSESIWNDYLKTRKAAMTETALEGLRREADKAGLSLQSALETCCAHGWRGFKAEWIGSRRGPGMLAKPSQTLKALQNLEELKHAPALAEKFD